MKHHVFVESNSYPVAILLKHTSFNKQEIIANYTAKLNELGIPNNELIAFTLSYNDSGKAPAGFIKEYLVNLLKGLDSLQTQYLYVTDAAYFKVLVGVTKAEPHWGYVLPCKIKGYEHMKVVLGINYQQLIYNPDLRTKLNQGLQALVEHKTGRYHAPGTGIIHSAQYPEGTQAIAEALQSLHQYPSLTCDIEGFSLRFNEAGIGTIAFAWDEHNGIAFACDYESNLALKPHPRSAQLDPNEHGFFAPNKEIRALLLEFFLEYKGEITWHNCCYDVKVIIYNLWMKDLLDTEGLLCGLDIMTARMHDTKIIAYLATNSTAGNVLGLKPLAHEFAGNWAKEDIKDIRRIPLVELLQYNLVDSLSCWYVKNKYTPKMIEDRQEDLYKGLMLDSLKTIIQMELTGMPMNPQTILEVKEDLEKQQEKHSDTIMNSEVVRLLNKLLRASAMEAKNAKLKVKQHTLDHFDGVEFNPNSGPQLQRLLYEQMGLPVLDYTDTKQPSTAADTIEKLIHHTQEPMYKDLLSALIGYNKVSKILTTFIPAFERGIVKEDGMRWLHGSFNLGSVVSGRLSSNSPNLQNLPSGSTFGKAIKKCFVAPKGWVMAYADFNALEAVVCALVTKDPAKLVVFTDGYDSHAFNAYGYWKEKMPDIQQTVNHINSIDGEIYRVVYNDGTVGYLSHKEFENAKRSN